MAYMNFLAAATISEVEAVQKEPSRTLRSAKLCGVSHLIARWGLGTPHRLPPLLSEVLDGGQILSPEFKHPLRVPKYHPPIEVVRLYEALDSCWNATVPEITADDWYRDQVPPVLEVFNFAASTDACVLSFLEMPIGAKQTALRVEKI